MSKDSPKTFKLDIKEVLHNIDMKNIDWFDTLSEEQQTAFNPYVIMQFLTGGNEVSLELSNVILNKNFNTKSKHKGLFYRLACTLGEGSKAYHPYTKPPKASKAKASLLVGLLSEYYGEVITDQEAAMTITKNSSIYGIDYWEMIAESLDWDNDTIKKLVKEIKPMLKATK